MPDYPRCRHCDHGWHGLACEQRPTLPAITPGPIPALMPRLVQVSPRCPCPTSVEPEEAS